MTTFIQSISFIWVTALLVTTKANAEDFYTLQLQVDPTQESSMQRLTQLPQVHRAIFSPSEHFIYLGQFDTEEEANRRLDKVRRVIEPQVSNFNPMIVELFIHQAEQIEPLSMARQKRLEKPPQALRAEPAQSHTTLTPPVVTATAVATDYKAQADGKPSKAKTVTVKEGYSIQVAVFKNQSNYRRFIDDHPSGDFYCNIDTSESTVIHMGIFDKFSIAKQRLKEAGDFGDLSPYIITLNDAQLTNCH